MSYVFNSKHFKENVSFTLDKARLTLLSLARQYLNEPDLTSHVIQMGPVSEGSNAVAIGLEIGEKDPIPFGLIFFDDDEAYSALKEKMCWVVTFYFEGSISKDTTSIVSSKANLTGLVKRELKAAYPSKEIHEITSGNNWLNFELSHDRTFSVTVGGLKSGEPLMVGYISGDSEGLAVAGVVVPIEIGYKLTQERYYINLNATSDIELCEPIETDRKVLNAALDPEDPDPIGTIEEIIKPMLEMANKMVDIKSEFEKVQPFLNLVFSQNFSDLNVGFRNTIITGESRHGRTTLGMQLAVEASNRHFDVRYMNDEDSNPAAKIISLGGKPTGRIKVFNQGQMDGFVTNEPNTVYIFDLNKKTAKQVVAFVGPLRAACKGPVITIVPLHLSEELKFYSDKESWTTVTKDRDGVQWNRTNGESFRYFDILYKEAHKNYIEANSAINVVTSQFKPESILFHDKDFYVASGKWVSGNTDDLACRYHVVEGLGYPNGLGNRQWMRLPVALKDVILEKADSLMIQFKRSPLNVEVGQWIRTKDGSWHLATYLYGNEEMVSAIGLGKSDDYPILIKEIDTVAKAPSALHKYHRGRILLWHINGYVFLTFEGTGSWGQSVSPENGLYYKRFVHRKVDGKWAAGEQVSLAYFYQLNDCDLLMELDTLPDSISEFMAPIDIQLLLNRARVKVRFPVDADSVSDMDSYFGEESYHAYV